jgi:hypothetical protein
MRDRNIYGTDSKAGTIQVCSMIRTASRLTMHNARGVDRIAVSFTAPP